MPIPKLIHTIWAGGSKLLPEENAERLKDIARKNPDFQMIVWIDTKTTTEEELEKYNHAPYFFDKDPKILLADINEHKVVDKHSRYHIDKTLPNYGASSDLLRYRILEKLGGIYLDSDYRVTKECKPFNHDGLFDDPQTEILKINQFAQGRNNIGNDGFICTPHHPFMKQLYETAIANHRDKLVSACRDQIYNFDGILSPMKEEKKSSLRSARVDWTVICTGPNAVVQVCADIGILDENPPPEGVIYRTIPGYSMDTSCFKPMPSNDRNWTALRPRKFNNLDDAIKAAVHEIHYETKHMGLLALNYHIEVIRQALDPTSLRDEQIAERLIRALEKNPPDLKQVTTIQLLSKHPIVREYYRKYTPGLDDNLRTWPAIYSYDQSSTSFYGITTKALGALDRATKIVERQAIAGYTTHILNNIENAIIIDPEAVNLAHLNSLLKLKTMLERERYYQQQYNQPIDSKSTLSERVDGLFPQVIALSLNNLASQGKSEQVIITQLTKLFNAFTNTPYRSIFKENCKVLMGYLNDAAKTVVTKPNILRMVSSLQDFLHAQSQLFEIFEKISEILPKSESHFLRSFVSDSDKLYVAKNIDEIQAIIQGLREKATKEEESVNPISSQLFSQKDLTPEKIKHREVLKIIKDLPTDLPMIEALDTLREKVDKILAVSKIDAPNPS